jgi:hypothetical protein
MLPTLCAEWSARPNPCRNSLRETHPNGWLAAWLLRDGPKVEVLVLAGWVAEIARRVIAPRRHRRFRGNVHRKNWNEAEAGGKTDVPLANGNIQRLYCYSQARCAEYGRHLHQPHQR